MTYIDVKTGVTGKERNSTHQILGTSHLTNGDKRSPLLLKIWVIVKDLLCPASTLALKTSSGVGGHSQCRQHVSRRDAVHADPCMRPLDRQTRCQMTDGSLGRVVRGLRLRNVHNCARHATNHNNASGGLPLHEVLRNGNGIQIGTINVDSP